MKNTKLFKISCDKIDKFKLKEASEILREGGTIAFPTETVYGLGANALDENAVKKIFEAKGRPSDNPLIVHISDFNGVEKLSREIPSIMKVLAKRFWPGPLTMIVKKSSEVPDAVTAGLDTVAIRLPSHPIAKTLIEMAGIPIAAPSANLSGKPSTTSENHVIEDLMGKVDGIVCGGSSQVGVESTVLDITCVPPMILRPGGVTKEELEAEIGQVLVDPALINEEDKKFTPKSPGMKYTHYSPSAKVIIIKGDMEKVVAKIKELRRINEASGLRVGIMATEETKDMYRGNTIISLGSRRELSTIATSLFKALRDFDKEGIDLILAEAYEEKGLGQAIMNRLTKAAGYNVVETEE